VSSQEKQPTSIVYHLLYNNNSRQLTEVSSQEKQPTRIVYPLQQQFKTVNRVK
jgi:hypothetical protein